jgi:hypothetical protein
MVAIAGCAIDVTSRQLDIRVKPYDTIVLQWTTF